MHHEWGRLIILYLFLGGLSAGTLILSSLATLADRGRFARIACYGAFAAPLPVILGTGLLVLDLGQPFFFWKLLVAFRPQSPMWIGTWLLTLFAVVSTPYAALFLPAPLRRWNPSNRHRWQWRLAAIALPIGIGVGLYTGVLLSVLVARPLWNTPLLAQLFLVSALSTGTALLLGLLRGSDSAEARRFLVRTDTVLIAVELVLLASLFLAGRTSNASAAAAVGTLFHGVPGAVFWIGVVVCGLVMPLVIETAELGEGRGWRHRLAGAGSMAAFLVLTGGFALRWVLVVAGQTTALVGQP